MSISPTTACMVCLCDMLDCLGPTGDVFVLVAEPTPCLQSSHQLPPPLPRPRLLSSPPSYPSFSSQSHNQHPRPLVSFFHHQLRTNLLDRHVARSGDVVAAAADNKLRKLRAVGRNVQKAHVTDESGSTQVEPGGIGAVPKEEGEENN